MFSQSQTGYCMGKLIVLIGVFLIWFSESGCSDSKVNKSDKPIVDIGGTSINDTIINSQHDGCEQFLRDYESWVNTYINLIKRYQKNPKDKSIIEDYEKMLAEIGKWDIRSRQCIKDSAVFIKYEKLQEQLNTYAIKVALTK